MSGISVAETEFKPEVEKPIEQQWLEAHNSFRKSEGRIPLQWDTDLVKVAEKWLYNLKESCKLYNSKSGYGEALWGDISNPAISKTVEDWMAGYKTNKCAKNRTKSCVNAVQILWPSTSRVGCSEVNCVLKSRKNEIKSRTIMTIRGCIYDPPSLRRVKSLGK
jgi:uncharacterized protein YkwD